MTWQTQKLCTDVGDYELTVEKQKRSWECDQKSESWRWIVAYRGSVVARGSVNSREDAKRLALENVPENTNDE